MEYRQGEDPGHDGRKGDTPEYVRRMQEELSEVLGEARSQKELRRIEPRAREISGMYRDELADAEVRELVIHRRVGRQNYTRGCAETSAVQAYVKRGMPLAQGMEIGYAWRPRPQPRIMRISNTRSLRLSLK